MLNEREKNPTVDTFMPIPSDAVKVQSRMQQLWMTSVLGYSVVQVWDHPTEVLFGKTRFKKIWWLKK